MTPLGDAETSRCRMTTTRTATAIYPVLNQLASQGVPVWLDLSQERLESGWPRW